MWSHEIAGTYWRADEDPGAALQNPYGHLLIEAKQLRLDSHSLSRLGEQHNASWAASRAGVGTEDSAA